MSQQTFQFSFDPPLLSKGTRLIEPTPACLSLAQFHSYLAAFRDFGKETQETQRTLPGITRQIPCYTNEFWTAKQCAANSLHEISYRACFKPQLPRFFIEGLTAPGARIYDPFMGRGTTLIEAALLGRKPAGCDINPLSLVLTRPRLHPPEQDDVAARLAQVPLNNSAEFPEELLVFYHPETLREICSLKRYLLDRHTEATYDAVDDWIAMVALNRLTGHSQGFFSVYTLPPNQAVSVKSQKRINERRAQTPPRRDVVKIILKKSKQLLVDCDDSIRATIAKSAHDSILLTAPADQTPALSEASVDLVVTSPPFLRVVQYAVDNWLRCWFLGIDASKLQITFASKLQDWQLVMTRAFRELCRVLKPGGYVAFEVGEVDQGSTNLEDAVLPCGLEAGLIPALILINQQVFTKTAQCWGVDNNAKGTNSNRVVLFTKK